MKRAIRRRIEQRLARLRRVLGFEGGAVAVGLGGTTVRDGVVTRVADLGPGKITFRGVRFAASAVSSRP